MTTVTQFITTLILVLLTQLSLGQEYAGQWTGALDIQGTELPLILDITQSEDGYESKLTSPKQGNQAMNVEETKISGNQLEFSISSLQLTYKGTLSGEKIEGTFQQGPMSLPLVLEKKAYEEKPANRPQEPKGPFTYHVEDVVYSNAKAGGIALAGTFTKPKDVKNPPVAIMISGSGPQDRNEEIFGHKPFWVIADHFARNGIAVLRYDDRGTASSKGEFSSATSADFATDVEAAISYLKTRSDINTKQIGLIGHSEGGFIAPMVAKDKKNDVAFIISLAGTGVQGDKLLKKQMRLGAELTGADNDLIDYEMNLMGQIIDRATQPGTQEELSNDMKNIMNTMKENMPAALLSKYTDQTIESIASQFSSPWMVYLFTTDPQPNWEQVKCPVLALNGGLDYQVPAGDNLEGISAGLKKAKNKDVTIKEFDGLNHLFQTANSGSGAEYSMIEETIAPQVLDTMTQWIHQRFQ